MSSTHAPSGWGRLPALTGDARVDRWREHRANVRAELVEATLRAIDEYGPDLSIDEVVKTAGVPRPKLYRFFEDKDALFASVGERVQQMIVERVVPQFDFSATAFGLVRSGLTAYVGLVDERPNVFRFLVGSHFSENRSAMELLDGGRLMAETITAVIAEAVTERGGNGENLEYVVDASLGAIALAVLRWLNTPTISKDALIDELTSFIWGSAAAVARGRGLILDPDERLPVPHAD